MQVYIWSGDDNPALKDYYSSGLYVASGNSKKEAARKIAKKYRHCTWDEHLQRIQYVEKRIMDLKNGGKTNFSPGVEEERLQKYLKQLLNITSQDIENENNRYESCTYNKLIQHEPKIVEVEDLAVFVEEVG